MAIPKGKLVTPIAFRDDLTPHALEVDDSDHLKTAVQSSELPTGAATAANQATIITALQLIDDLRAALNDVGTDELRVMAAQYGSTWKIPRADTDGRLIVKAGIDGSTPEMLNVDSAGTLAVHPALYGAARKELKVDVNSYLRIAHAAQELDLEVIQQAPADLTTGIHGWSGSTWRKLPMLFGYTSQYSEIEAANDVGAGDAIQTFSTVPTGEVWVITAFSAYPAQANAIRCTLIANTGAGAIRIKTQAALTAFTSIEAPCPIILNVDDYLTVEWKTASAGDDFRAYALGYKMDVAA